MKKFLIEVTHTYVYGEHCGTIVKYCYDSLGRVCEHKVTTTTGYDSVFFDFNGLCRLPLSSGFIKAYGFNTKADAKEAIKKLDIIRQGDWKVDIKVKSFEV